MNVSDLENIYNNDGGDLYVEQMPSMVKWINVTVTKNILPPYYIYNRSPSRRFQDYVYDYTALIVLLRLVPFVMIFYSTFYYVCSVPPCAVGYPIIVLLTLFCDHALYGIHKELKSKWPTPTTTDMTSAIFKYDYEYSVAIDLFDTAIQNIFTAFILFPGDSFNIKCLVVLSAFYAFWNYINYRMVKKWYMKTIARDKQRVENFANATTNPWVGKLKERYKNYIHFGHQRRLYISCVWLMLLFILPYQ